MTAPLTSRRRYSNVAPAALLNTGINASDTAYALTTGTGFPPTPFPLIIDFDGAAEEVVLVTGLSGANVTSCTRGYDGTTAQSHSVGATCVHGMIAKDAEEASQHTSSTGAHGTASPIVGTTDAQTVTNKTVSSSKLLATATDPAVKAQAASTGAARLVEAYDAAGTGLLLRVGRAGDVLVSPNDPAVKPLVAKAEAAQTASIAELQDNGGSPLWLVDAKGRIVHKPSDLTTPPTPAYKHVPPSAAAATFLQLRDSADASDQFVLSVFGEILNAAKAWLRGISTDDPIRFPLDGSKFKVDKDGDITAASLTSVGAVTGNNLLKARTADAGKIQQFGTFSASFSSANSDSGTLSFPQAFSSATGIVVVGTVQAGSNFDLLLNWQAAPTTTGVNWRVAQKDGANFTGSATVHWIAIGPA